MYYIYALIDPRDELVYYVGMSKQPYHRLGQHLQITEDDSVKNNWIKELTDNGYTPRLQILEQVEGLTNAQKQEAYWIQVYTNLGMPLTNAQQGIQAFPDQASLLQSEVSTRALIERIILEMQSLRTQNKELHRKVARLQKEVTELKAQGMTLQGPLLPSNKTSTQSVEEKIIHQVRVLQIATAREVSQRVAGLDTASARLKLEDLVRSGILEKIETTRVVRYQCLAG